MKNINLNELRERLSSLAIFRELLQRPVMSALTAFLQAPDVSGYSAFVAALYESGAPTLSDYIRDICADSDNIYVRIIGQKKIVPAYMQGGVKVELDILQDVAALTPEDLRTPLDFTGFLPAFESGDGNIRQNYLDRVAHIDKYGYGIYSSHHMFYADDEGNIIPVHHPDKTRLCDLVDYESERQIVIDNTRALLAGKPAANILLTGDAGTGKSSTVKAVANALYPEGLRIIEVRKNQLNIVPKILDVLACNPLKFILFIDDLSFSGNDDNYSALKAVLEGSVSAKSHNVVIYATSNRRHMIKESFSDREGDDVHHNDTMQELLSLSERFGIHVTFSKPGKETYLLIVRKLAQAKGIRMDTTELEKRAEQFALARGGRSARLAGQFTDELLAAQ